MSSALPVLLAGVGGAAVVLAAWELALGIEGARSYLRSAAGGLRRAGSEGSLPSRLEQRRLGVLAGLMLGAVVFLLAGPGPTALAALLGPAGAGRLVSGRRRAYRRRLEAQVPDLANGIADALAAGGSLRTALIELAGTVEGPAAVELARVRADLALGSPPREALRGLADRVASEPIQALVGAMLSQQRTGGNLAELLRVHAEAAAKRRRAEEEARSATAQARLTGGMVAAMPLGAAVLVELASPGFVASMLSDPLAVALLAGALALQMAGYVLIQRLGRVGEGS